MILPFCISRMLGFVISTIFVLNNLPAGKCITTDSKITCNDLSESCNHAINTLVEEKLRSELFSRRPSNYRKSIRHSTNR